MFASIVLKRCVVVLLGMGIVSSCATASKSLDKQALAETARCAVWRREASFASSVEMHDARAFAEHLAKGAVFLNGQSPHLHGEAAIIEGWSEIVQGKGLTLRWHPEFVAVGGDGRTALSRGPFTMEREDVNPEARFRIGVFMSTWIKGDDGQWRVVFDGGGPPSRAATEEEVRAMQKSWSTACPFVD